MDKIILIGAGGHARSCIDVIESLGEYEIIGLIEKDEKKVNANLGYPIIGTDQDLEKYSNKYSNALITVGQIKSSEIRLKLYKKLKKIEFQLPIIVSPNAYVSQHSQIGEGSIIMHGAIINANAKIGSNCIINNKSLIEHDAVIGDNCHIATGAIINGQVSVGHNTFIGSGVVTKQSLVIGNNCIIGSGVVLKNDVNSNKVIRK